jgi:hypothetical protein
MQLTNDLAVGTRQENRPLIKLAKGIPVTFNLSPDGVHRGRNLTPQSKLDQEKHTQKQIARRRAANKRNKR